MPTGARAGEGPRRSGRPSTFITTARLRTSGASLLVRPLVRGPAFSGVAASGNLGVIDAHIDLDDEGLVAPSIVITGEHVARRRQPWGRAVRAKNGQNRSAKWCRLQDSNL